MTRITVVLEYKDDAAVPRIGVGTKEFGDFQLVAVQFNDALKELEALSEFCSDEERQQAWKATSATALRVSDDSGDKHG